MEKMARHIRGYNIPLLVSASLLLLCVLTAFFYTFVGQMEDMGADTPLSVADFSSIPQSVVEDATAMAKELVGDYKGKYNEFVNQLLALYVEAEDKDVVVVFNPGGWGSTHPRGTNGWVSIGDGIRTEMKILGYNTLFINYQRTEGNLRGAIDEFVELLSIYPTKADKLAKRVEFLTKHLPNLNVIVAGDSNGTIISDSVMNELRDNQRVYSIQTGPPFWHRPTVGERTLVVDNNGIMPDALAKGDAGAILLASAKALLGLTPRDDPPGDIMNSLRAPGHDYSWQYPSVYYQITNFLEKNFGFKQS
jgi:hypothetical protein